MRWRITLEVGHHQPDRTVVLERETGEPVTIGRAGCDVVIAIGAMARHHGSLEVQPDGQVVVVDSGNGSGCWIRGQRSRRATVAPGDEIYMGQACIRLAAAPEPLAQQS